MATKVKVVLQRVEVKDYRDLAAMIRSGVSLDRGMAAARKIYGGNFQPSESLKAMTYFEGGDLRELSKSDRETLVTAVRQVRELPNVQILSSALSAQVLD